jgi:uncharacterized protein YeaO (DUF488 family)
MPPAEKGEQMKTLKEHAENIDSKFSTKYNKEFHDDPKMRRLSKMISHDIVKIVYEMMKFEHEEIIRKIEKNLTNKE